MEFYTICNVTADLILLVQDFWNIHKAKKKWNEIKKVEYMYCQNNKTLIYNLSGLLGIFLYSNYSISFQDVHTFCIFKLKFLVVPVFSVYPFKPDNYKLLLFYFGQKHNFICWIYFIKNIDFEKKNPLRSRKLSFAVTYLV